MDLAADQGGAAAEGVFETALGGAPVVFENGIAEGGGFCPRGGAGGVLGRRCRVADEVGLAGGEHLADGVGDARWQVAVIEVVKVA